MGIAEGVDHGVLDGVDVEGARSPGAAICAAGMEDEHGVVYCCAGESLDVDGGGEGGLGVFGPNARGDCDICRTWSVQIESCE